MMELRKIGLAAVSLILVVALWGPIGLGMGINFGGPGGMTYVRWGVWGWCVVIEVDRGSGSPDFRATEEDWKFASRIYGARARARGPGSEEEAAAWKEFRSFRSGTEPAPEGNSKGIFFHPWRLALTIVCTAGILAARRAILRRL